MFWKTDRSFSTLTKHSSPPARRKKGQRLAAGFEKTSGGTPFRAVTREGGHPMIPDELNIGLISWHLGGDASSVFSIPTPELLGPKPVAGHG